MIHVIATVQLHPGKRDAFIAEFHQVVPLVHAEVGCVEYGPTIDAQTDIVAQQRVGDDAAVIVERWESIEALKAHLAADHMTTYRAKVKHLVVSTSLQIFETA